MPTLSKFGQLLPYFIVSRFVEKIAPYTAELVFGNYKIPVYVRRMSNDEWVVRRLK